jgi:hypothetical protein
MTTLVSARRHAYRSPPLWGGAVFTGLDEISVLTISVSVSTRFLQLAVEAKTKASPLGSPSLQGRPGLRLPTVFAMELSFFGFIMRPEHYRKPYRKDGN